MIYFAPFLPLLLFYFFFLSAAHEKKEEKVLVNVPIISWSDAKANRSGRLIQPWVGSAAARGRWTLNCRIPPIASVFVFFTVHRSPFTVHRMNERVGHTQAQKGHLGLFLFQPVSATAGSDRALLRVR
ncbi:hypothetical protein F4778DRAFT_300562 [Xylariomycetidae sp. FL2044]|nr:hypothetical protein F4778DRAFT_300562 [Xylariomycetidae sp. FL2044]